VERPPVRFGMDPSATTKVTTPAPGVHVPAPDKRPGELNYFPLEMFDDGAFQEEGGMSRNVLLASKGTRLRGAGSRAFSKVRVVCLLRALCSRALTTLLWYRLGLCQCRTRTGHVGYIVRFSLPGAGVKCRTQMI
jgi:hypothetical protein